MKREEQRERLLGAAYDLIGEVGVGGLRTRDIAERAGVNVATLHYCFETKDALLEDLYRYILERVSDERARFLEGCVSPSDMLRGHSELRLHFLRDKPASVRVWRAYAEGVWSSGVVRDIMRKHFADVRSKLAAVIVAGRADGSLAHLPVDDDSIVASMLMSLYDGLIFQWVVDPDNFPVDAYSAAILAWLGLSSDHGVAQ